MTGADQKALQAAGRAWQAQRFGDVLRLTEPEGVANSLHGSHLRGLALAQIGRLGDAVEALERTCQLLPTDVERWMHLGLIARQDGSLEVALRAFQQASECASPTPDCFVQGAELAIEADNMDLADEFLKHGLERFPDQPDLLATTAQSAEQSNRLQDAREFANRAVQARPDHFKGQFLLARLEMRAEDPGPARDRLQTLSARTDLTPANRSLVLSRLAELERKSERYARAFQLQDLANQALLPLAKNLSGQNLHAPVVATRLRAYLNADRLRQWRSEPVSQVDAEPVFLVGFPRSGTTLLDRMLAASGNCTILEEQPTVLPLLERFATATGLADLDHLGMDETSQLAASYLAGLPRSNQQVIDKMPLNAMWISVIHRIFPRARFLVAIRDPRDVILSCFFQSFAINEAMAAFLRWETTVEFYQHVMSLLTQGLDSLQIRHAVVRYEDLVTTPRSALSDALDLLEIPWSDEISNYHTQHNERINTPSYEQVSRPLYRTAVANWRHYPGPIEQATESLTPAMVRWNYL